MASVSDLLLVSVLKGIDVAVYDAVMEAAGGDFSTTPFVGTLENGAVGLSPFHDFASKVDADLADGRAGLGEKLGAQRLQPVRRARGDVPGMQAVAGADEGKT